MKSLLSIAFAFAVASSFAQDQCCGEKESKVETKAAATKKQGECCKSTDEKPIAKFEKGCCNADGESAKFKVFVVSTGKYKLFGCEDTANEWRSELLAKGEQAGKVQKVLSKKLKIS